MMTTTGYGSNALTDAKAGQMEAVPAVVLKGTLRVAAEAVVHLQAPGRQAELQHYEEGDGLPLYGGGARSSFPCV